MPVVFILANVMHPHTQLPYRTATAEGIQRVNVGKRVLKDAGGDYLLVGKCILYLESSGLIVVAFHIAA